MWTNEGPDLYLNADRTKVLQEGDPEVAFLLVAHGGQLPIEDAEKYGLTGTAAPEAAPEADAEKAKTAPPNKAKESPTNKSK